MYRGLIKYLETTYNLLCFYINPIDALHNVFEFIFRKSMNDYVNFK